MGGGVGELGNTLLQLWHNLFQSQKAIRLAVRHILITSVTVTIL